MPRDKSGPAAAGETLTDGQLVRRVLAGETALFEILAHRHSQQIYRAARAILRDHDEAADVLQETLLRAYRNLDQFAGKAKFSTWLTKIAVYEARRRLRRRAAGRSQWRSRASVERSWTDPADEPDLERRVLGREMKSVIEAAVESLPAPYRTVFMMRSVQEMSTADTAEILNLTEDAVKTRLKRARALLRKRLERAVGPVRRETFRFAGEACRRMWLERIRPVIGSAKG